MALNPSKVGTLAPAVTQFRNSRRQAMAGLVNSLGAPVHSESAPDGGNAQFVYFAAPGGTGLVRVRKNLRTGQFRAGSAELLPTATIKKLATLV